MARRSLPKIHREVRCGAMTALYVIDRVTGRLGLWLVPAARRRSVAARRELLSGVEVDGMGHLLRAWSVDPLLQLKSASDDAPAAFANGRTFRNSVTVDRMSFTGQEVTRDGAWLRVRTDFSHPDGWRAYHELSWRRGASWVESAVTVENSSAAPLTLEFLASFSLGGLTPFAADAAPGRLRLHRFRAVWSMEGRLDSRDFEDLQLEPSWAGSGVRCERFGEIGALPVNGFFPFIAVEDTGAGVVWGAQLAHPGSWQMEAYRRDDQAAISGGLADRDLGHWTKTLAPGTSFTSPRANLACVAGSLEDLGHALTAAQELPLAGGPAAEATLPVIFNEWATSWGNPSHDNATALAQALRGTGVSYLVMDAGWYKPPTGDWSTAQGEWEPNAAMYPQGLRATTDAIRACGLIPGLWFEMEVVGAASPLFGRTDLMLQRGGRPITVGPRRFLDFRKPEVVVRLRERVIGPLRDGNFGYLKVDYNDNIGSGVDGSESPGENLRQHLAAVQTFFREIRAALPDLVIENCSSGGHRLEPSMMGLTAMGSFSDAHECPEIPIIAANLHSLILPRQSQIWAVLRSGASLRRTAYVLASGFLGRLCLSGDFTTLRPEQRRLADRAIALYQRSAGAIKAGRSYRHGPAVKTYRRAEGWQAVVRVGVDGREALVVAHTFAKPSLATLRIPLPKGRWRVADEFPAARSVVKLAAGELRWKHPGAWSGAVILLRR